MDISNFYDPQIKIVGSGRRENFQWDYRRIPTPYFHLYWNDTPGGSITWHGNNIELNSSFAILIPPFTVFSESSHKSFNHNYIQFTAEAPFDLVYPAPKIMELNQEDLREFQKLKDLFCNPEPQPRQFLQVKYLVCHTLLKLEESDFLSHTALSPEIAAVMKMIAANIEKPLSNAALAKAVNLSLSTLTRHFRNEVGQSLHSYVLFMKIRAAMPLLKSSGQSIDQIAATLGFADRYHFTRVFKQYTASTPARFREV